MYDRDRERDRVKPNMSLQIQTLPSVSQQESYVMKLSVSNNDLVWRGVSALSTRVEDPNPGSLWGSRSTQYMRIRIRVVYGDPDPDSLWGSGSGQFMGNWIRVVRWDSNIHVGSI